MSNIERYGPIVLASTAFLASWLFLGDWNAYLSARGQEFENAFSPVFDFATFSAGALFAIYFLALSRSDGFLGRIFETQTFRRFHAYVSWSVVLNVALSLWTAGFMIVGLTENSGFLAAAWIGLVAWSLLASARVVIIFLMMVRVRSRRPLASPS